MFITARRSANNSSKKWRLNTVRLLGPKFPNIAEERGRLFVKSEHRDFGEDLVYRDGETWRPWEAKRSKVAAGVLKRLSQIGIREGDTVLYLGAAHGYTATFIADIVGPRGVVFSLDFSANVVRDLLRKSRARPNMIPVLADAKRPDSFAYRVTGADVIIMDIAQRDQVAIFLRNVERFLRPEGFGILALKARSVDTSRAPKDVFKEAYKEIEKHVKVVDYRELDPFEKDHAIFVVKKQG
jgi:fibrillarin-like pre-rRNA processing protein